MTIPPFEGIEGNVPIKPTSEVERILKGLLPRLEQAFAPQIAAEQPTWQRFFNRLETHFPRLFELYG